MHISEHTKPLRTLSVLFGAIALSLVGQATAMADDPVASPSPSPSPSPSASGDSGSGDLCPVTATDKVKGKSADAGKKSHSDANVKAKGKGKGSGHGNGKGKGNDTSDDDATTESDTDTVVTETMWVPCDELEGSQRSHGVWGAEQRRDALTSVAERLAAHAVAKGEGWTSNSLARIVELLNAYLPESMWVTLQEFVDAATAALEDGTLTDPADNPDDAADDTGDDAEDLDQDEPADE